MSHLFPLDVRKFCLGSVQISKCTGIQIWIKLATDDDSIDEYLIFCYVIIMMVPSMTSSTRLQPRCVACMKNGISRQEKYTMRISCGQQSIFHLRVQSSRQLNAQRTWIAKTAVTDEAPTVELSGHLKNSTAVLHDGSGGVAYVLGMSHVSKESCRLISELIEKVQPDAVMLELCHERTGLLVDEQAASTGQNAWYSDSVDIVGHLSGGDMKNKLLGLLRTYRGEPVSTAGIQQDADVLLATGLFESATPSTAPPPESGWDPMFIYADSVDKLITGVKLSSIQFKVVPRKLPRIAHIEVLCDDASASLMETFGQKIKPIMQKVEGVSESVVDALMDLRDEVSRVTENECHVVYSSIQLQEDGLHVVSRIVPEQQSGIFTTGLEDTVTQNGEGIGIAPIAKSRRFMGRPASNQSSSNAPQVHISAWSDSDVPRSADMMSNNNKSSSQRGILESLANAVTMKYAEYQANAGRKVGITPGEAWRVALAAAAKAKTPYVFLGDRLASVTGKKLVRGMIQSSIPYFALGAVMSLSSWLAPSLLFKVTPSVPTSFIVSLGSIIAATWPLLSPIQEIKAFSEMTPSDIEKAVRVNEPLQQQVPDGRPFYLWGEDALIRWPGAETPVINERDQYMSYSIYAFLKNIPAGLTPSFVATGESMGATVYSYAMPTGSSTIVSPTGKGQGQFTLQNNPTPKKIVAIVGTAHVRGMIATWNMIHDTQSNQHPANSPLESLSHMDS